MIEVNNIHKSFGDNHVLNDISFKFEAGKTNLIIGASGSGKTTLITSGLGSERMNYEQALVLCGGFGWFQMFVTFIFSMGLFTGG